MSVRFTENFIKSIKAKSKRFFITEGKNPGFTLRVYPSGRKVFYYKSIDGKPNSVLIGTWPDLSVKDARAIYKDLTYTPKTLKKGSTGAKAVGDESLFQLLRRYNTEFLEVRVKQGRLRKTTQTAYWGAVEKLINLLGGKEEAALADLNHDRLKPIIHEIADKQNMPSSANRIKEAVSSLSKWLIEEQLLSANPVADIPKAREKVRRVRLRTGSLEKLFQVLESNKAEPVVNIAFKLFLCLGFRSTEMIQSAPHNVVIGKHASWYIPAELAKSKTEFTQPIPSPLYGLINQLKTQYANSKWLFPMARDPRYPLSSYGLCQTLRRFCENHGIPHITPHGLRKTCGSMLAELKVPMHTISYILNHTSVFSGDVTTKHYIIYDYMSERLEALELLVNHYIDLGLQLPKYTKEMEKTDKHG